MSNGSNAMERVYAGVARFQQEFYPPRRELFQQLVTKQQPEVVFLTCADSRIDPALITQAQPGQLFICRNVGNVVPPHGTRDGGVATILEFAVDVLQAQHVVVCGHSDCGAMKSLLDPTDDQRVPEVTAWLRYAESARRITSTLYPEVTGKELLRAVTEQNVLAQMANLRTFPGIAAGLAAGTLQLHGWYYDIGTGEVTVYDAGSNTFGPPPFPAKRQNS